MLADVIAVTIDVATYLARLVGRGGTVTMGLQMALSFRMVVTVMMYVGATKVS